MDNKIVIAVVAFVMGMLTLALGYQVYVNYQLQGALNGIVQAYGADHATLGQIVSLINSNIKK